MRDTHKETRAEATHRLIAEGRWEEATQFRQEVREQLRARGTTKRQARDVAWKMMLEQFPPFGPGKEPDKVCGPSEDVTLDPWLPRAIERIFVRRLLDVSFIECPRDVVFRTTDEARVHWDRYCDRHFAEQEAFRGSRAAYRQTLGYAARLALLAHLMRWAAEDPTLDDPEAVDARSIEIGIALSTWVVDELRKQVEERAAEHVKC